MTKQKKLNGLNGTMNEQVPFTHQQIIDALYHVEEVLERAQIPFFLLEGAARQVHDNVPYFNLNQVDVGVMDKYMKDTGVSMIKMVSPHAYVDENNISFEHNGVPVIIWIIHEDFKFLKNPDTVFYGVSNFRIPNPFQAYWKSRFFVK